MVETPSLNGDPDLFSSKHNNLKLSLSCSDVFCQNKPVFQHNMDTLRLLRAQLDELLVAQPLVIRELAQLIFQIPGIFDSQVYGLMIRSPQAFLYFLTAQTRLSGHELPLEATSDDSLITKANELRTFMHIHFQRINLQADTRYAVILRGFSLPGESQNLDFADAFLTAAEALGHMVPQRFGNLVPFARAF